MRARFLRVLWLYALFVAACTVPLDLPRAPGASPPVVESVTPSEAYAGDTVVLRGTALTGASGRATVRFGASKGVEVGAEADGSLRVTVPDDAGAGSVAVTTEGGTGTHPYEFKGVGHLRLGRLAESADLRYLTARALPFGRGVAYLDTDRWRTLVVSRDGEPHNLPRDWFIDVATRGARVFALAANGAEGADGSGPCPSTLYTLRWPDVRGEDVEISQRNVAWAASGCEVPTAIAVDAEGSLAIIGDNHALGVVEPSGSIQTIGPGERTETAIASCGEGFVVTADTADDRTVVKTLARTASGWTLTPGAPFDVTGTVESIACRESTVVVLSSFGDLVGLRGGVEFARFQLRASSASGGRVALSTDGTRAFFSQPAVGRVVTVAVGPTSMEPLTSVVLEAPRGVDVDVDGTVSVAVPGGSVRLSQATGQVVEEVRFDAEFGLPRLRTKAPSAGGEASLVVDVNARTFGSVAELRATSLADGTEGIEPTAQSGHKYLVIDGTAAGRHLFAVDATPGRAIVRITGAKEDEGRLEAPQGRAIDAPVLSSTGRDLLVPLSDEDSGDTVELAVLAADGTLEMPSARIAAPEGADTSIVADDRTLAWTTRMGVVLHDLEAARRGQSRGRVLTAPGLTPDDSVRFDASLVRGLLTLVDTTTIYPRVHVVDPATGTWVTGDQVPCLLAEAVVLSPSGRHLWFTCPDTGESHALRTCAFELATGRIGRCEPAITLPGEPLGLVPTPDGEALLFIERASARLWRVE
jgi:hypothetical protein